LLITNSILDRKQVKTIAVSEKNSVPEKAFSIQIFMTFSELFLIKKQTKNSNLKVDADL